MSPHPRRHRSRIVRNYPLEWDGFEQRVQKITLKCWIVLGLIAALPVLYIGFDPTLLPKWRWQVFALAGLLVISSFAARWQLRRMDAWRKTGDRRRRVKPAANPDSPG